MSVFTRRVQVDDDGREQVSFDRWDYNPSGTSTALGPRYLEWVEAKERARLRRVVKVAPAWRRALYNGLIRLAHWVIE